MSLACLKYHFLLASCGAIRRFRLAALNALIILFVALLFLGVAESAVAQDIFGRIVGTVTDSSGATIPDVKVTFVNDATQASRYITTDRNGYFIADELPAGTYSVVAL
jgi:hypothetical protein